MPTDDGFHAEILEFPGCFAQGESAAEAYTNLERAAHAWIEACQEQGQDVPAPMANAGYSGKIVLRLPKSVHRQAARMAKRDGVSLNQFLVSSVSGRVGAEDLYTAIAERMERRIYKGASVAVNALGNYVARAVSSAEGRSLLIGDISKEIETTAGTTVN